MRIKDLLVEDYPEVHIEDNIKDVIDMFTAIPESSLPVVNDEGVILGEITQSNLLLEVIGEQEVSGSDMDFADIQHILSSGSDRIEPMVNRHELTVQPQDDVVSVVKLMYEEDLATIPVVESGELIGIVTDICILKRFEDLR